MRKNGSLTNSVSVGYRVLHDSYLTFFLGNLSHSKWRALVRLFCVCVLSCFMCVPLFAMLWTVAGHSSGKNTGVGCHALLQGIFPTPGSDLSILQVGSFLPCHPGRLFCNVLQIISVVIYSASLYQMGHLMNTRTSYLILFLLLKSHAIVLSI